MQVIDEMASKNLNVRMSPHFVKADFNKGNGYITMGVEGGIITEMAKDNNKYILALYVIDRQQFNELKMQP